MQRLTLFLLSLALFAGCAREKIERVEWTTMSTVAALQWVGEETPEIEAAKEVFERIVSLCNAHDATSELSRLAGSDDAVVLRKCDREVKPCYAAAFRLRDETGGRFDPRWRGAKTLDLGAIAKGFAVDLAAERLKTNGVRRMLVDLGGNLKAVRGDWNVGILGGETFTLREGEACATSAKYYRGEHIVNAATGEKVGGSLRSVTVVHPTSAMLADGLSTVMFILGREAGERFLKERYPEARVIWSDKTDKAGRPD